MELQALLVLCGLGVAGAAVILLMGLFSASGTSYEEAIAQQRRAANELLALAENKNKSKKTNKKANKKLAKKEKKENTTTATGSDPESEAPVESGVEDDSVPAKHHVEFSTLVAVDNLSDTPPHIKIRKRGKDPKVKPILLNKEDPSCVSDPSTTAAPLAEVSNHFEEMHPKDDLELLHASLEKVAEKKEEVEKKENKAPKQAKSAKSTTKQNATEALKEEVVRNNGDAPLEQRKTKKLEKRAVSDAAVEEVVPPLNAPQPSELTTDKLLRNALPASVPASASAGAPASTPTLARAPAPTPAPTTAPGPAPAPSPPAKGKKKKAEPNVLSLIAGDGGGVAVSELVRVVREAALSRTDIQVLTDALLNKHHDQLPEHSEWTEGPNDPMQKLKKQLAEKEKSLADEIEASQALHAKLKELRANLNAERGRATAASRAAEQATGATRAELHTLQARLQRLLDDNHALAQDKLMLQAKLNEESEAQGQRVQMEMHIQRLSEAEAALVAQLGALQAEAGALQAEAAARAVEAGQARCEAAAARDSALLAQQHGAELAQQLQEANRAYADLEQQRQCAVHAEQLVQQELHQLQARLAGLSEVQSEVQRLTNRAQAAEIDAEKLKEDMEKEKLELSKEISSLREQLIARETELAELKQLKAAPAQNGLPINTNNDEQKAAELAKVESVVESLRNELASAQKSSAEQKDQLASLQEQLAQYKEKNNELRTKNWKVMEALQTAEKALVKRETPAMPAQDAEAVSKAETQHYTEVANVLRSVCPTIAPSAKVGVEWLQAFGDTLKKELETKEAEKKQIEKDLSSKVLQKENERKQLESDLLKKIQEKESIAKYLEIKLQKQIQEKELAKNKIESELQQKLNDEVTIKNRLESELHKKQEVTVVKEGVQAADDSRVKDLKAQNEQLQGLVDQYKRIIDDTEGVLSQLQQDVSREEQRWAEQLADKQRELDSLRTRTMLQMQNKIDSLQAELQKLQPKTHSNSFADAERFTEERLMAGLSDKLDTDTHNGPLQVGFNEK